MRKVSFSLASTKADDSRLIPRKHTETLVLLSVHMNSVTKCI